MSEVDAVSVWQDAGPSYTHRGGQVSDTGECRVRLPRAALGGWPSDVGGWQCLVTTVDGEQRGGAVQHDRCRSGKRILVLPSSDDTQRTTRRGTLPTLTPQYGSKPNK